MPNPVTKFNKKYQNTTCESDQLRTVCFLPPTCLSVHPVQVCLNTPENIKAFHNILNTIRYTEKSPFDF